MIPGTMLLAPQACYCGEKTGKDAQKMEYYLNRAIAREHPLPQNIKYHCKEEGKGKDDQNLKKKNVEKRTEVFLSTLSVNSLLAYLVMSFLDWPITPARLLYSSPTC